jgi:hypothetical protein
MSPEPGGLQWNQFPVVQHIGTTPAVPLTLVRRGAGGEINGYLMHPNTIPSGLVIEVPVDMQMLTGGNFAVVGDLIVHGQFINV